MVINRENQLHFTRNIYSQPVIQAVKDQNRWIMFFKGFGLLKKEMIYWNVFQLIILLNRCVELIYTEIFLEIKIVLNDADKNSKFWSKWVDNDWDENCSHAVNLN